MTDNEALVLAENQRLRAREAEIAAIIRDGAPNDPAKWEAAVAWTLRHSAHVVECGECRQLMDDICAQRDGAPQEVYDAFIAEVGALAIKADASAVSVVGELTRAVKRAQLVVSRELSPVAERASA